MSGSWKATGVAILALCSASAALAIEPRPCSPDSPSLCESKLRPPPARYQYPVDGEYQASLLPTLSLDDEPPDTRARHRFGLDRSARDASTLFGRFPLTESFSIDLATSASTFESGRLRLAPSYPSAMPPSLRPGYDADRALWSINLGAARHIGAFEYAGRIGYLDVRDRPSGVFDTGTTGPGWLGERGGPLRQAYLGVDASYGFAQNWQFHGSAVYRRDIEPRIVPAYSSAFGGLPSAERDEKEWAVGLRYYGWRNFALNVEFLKTSGRDNFPSESLTFTGRIGF